MKKVKIIVIAIIALIVLCFVMFVPGEDDEYIWNPWDYARLVEVDYKAVVVDEPESNGKIVITERLTFDIHAFSRYNLFWELWRALPEDIVDGVKVDYTINSVKQVFNDGTRDVIFAESPILYWYDYHYTYTDGGYGPNKWFHSEGPYSIDLRQYECVLFYVDGIYRDTVIFEIEYEMQNAALRWADSSELYISLFSGSEIKHLKSFRGQILFPEDKMPRTGNFYANTFGTNSHTFPFSQSNDANPGFTTFYFELDKSQLRFRPYNQYIEFALVSFGEDRHVFTQYASRNDYYNDDMLYYLWRELEEYEALPGRYRAAKVITLLSLTATLALTIAIVFLISKNIKKKYTFYKPSVQVEYFRDIPTRLDPNFAATLAFSKHRSKLNIQDGYSAVMLSLTQKGYIELIKINEQRIWDSHNVKILVKYSPPQSVPTQQLPQQPLQNQHMPQQHWQARNWQNQQEQQVWQNHAWQHQPWQAQPQQPDLTYEPTATNLEPLTPTESLYFNLILRHSRGTEIPLKEFQARISTDYQYTNSFVKNVKNAVTSIGVTAGYFQKAYFKDPKDKAAGLSVMLSIFGILILTIGNLISYQTRLDLSYGAFFLLGCGLIISAIVLSWLYKELILLTQFGEDEYTKWRGLYNFLNSETLMSERTVVELPIWEYYLIYATVFGISEKVIKALEIRCPNAEQSSILRRGSFYRTMSFRARVGTNTFRSATSRASFNARSGGHGGYGGGGRGGGGGGGGH